MPEVLGVAFETKERMVGRTTFFDGIVSDSGFLLSSVKRQDSRIDIEDQASGLAGLGNHVLEKMVVNRSQFGQCGGSETRQEAAQRGGIRIGGETGEILEDAIVFKQARSLDSLDSQHHGIEERQERFPNRVIGVTLSPRNMFGNGGLESDTTEETVQKIHAPVVREGLIATRGYFHSSNKIEFLPMIYRGF